MTGKEKYPCPSCGFIVFDEPPGSYDICPICNWEDDPVQLRDPSTGGGANRESLYQSQQKVLLRLPLPVREYEQWRREIDWRPLREEEKSREYFSLVDGNVSDWVPVYYWRPSGSSA